MKNQKLKFNNEKSAFTIVETLVTLLAITLMIIGPVTFMYKSYTYAEFIKAKIISTGLSQEGLELVTAMRNSDLANFQTEVTNNNCASGCMIDWSGTNSSPLLSSCTGLSCALYSIIDSNGITTQMYRKNGTLETGFYRQIIITPNAANQSYTIESKTWSSINGIDVTVNLKKTLFKIVIK